MNYFNLLFYMSICGFCLNYHYYLKSLMMIEFVSVSIMLMMLGSSLGVFHYVVYVLILSVCEGIMGVLILVVICRFWLLDSYMLIDYDF